MPPSQGEEGGGLADLLAVSILTADDKIHRIRTEQIPIHKLMR